MWNAAARGLLLSASLCLMLVRHLTDGHRLRLLLTLADDVELGLGVRRQHADGPDHLPGVLHLRAVDGRDDIAGVDAGLGRWAAFLRLVNHCAFGLLQAKAVGNARGHRLDLNAEPTAGDVAMVLQLGDDKLRGVGGDVEADADRTAGR